MFAGREQAWWALQFAERCFKEPGSLARAQHAGGDDWAAWYRFDHVARRVADLTDVFISAHTDPQKTPQVVDRPGENRRDPVAPTLLEAFAGLAERLVSPRS